MLQIDKYRCKQQIISIKVLHWKICIKILHIIPKLLFTGSVLSFLTVTHIRSPCLKVLRQPIHLFILYDMLPRKRRYEAISHSIIIHPEFNTETGNRVQYQSVILISYLRFLIHWRRNHFIDRQALCFSYFHTGSPNCTIRPFYSNGRW